MTIPIVSIPVSWELFLGMMESTLHTQEVQRVWRLPLSNLCISILTSPTRTISCLSWDVLSWLLEVEPFKEPTVLVLFLVVLLLPMQVVCLGTWILISTNGVQCIIPFKYTTHSRNVICLTYQYVPMVLRSSVQTVDGVISPQCLLVGISRRNHSLRSIPISGCLCGLSVQVGVW